MVAERPFFLKWISQLWAFIRLGRYPFLIGGFIQYALGGAIAAYQGVQLNWAVYLWGQIVVTATQLMVHYANDYYDMAADRANLTSTLWSGGSRVLINGHLSPRVAQVAAFALALLTLVGSVLLIVAEQTPVLQVLLLPAILLSWFYSAPPVRLHSRGVGELSATLVVAFLTPFTAYFLQARQLTTMPILAAIPISLLQFNMLVSVAIPDMEGDALSGKHTLVVRWGRETTSRIYLVVMTLAYGLQPLLMISGLPALVVGMFSLSLIIAIPLGWWIWRGAWSRSQAWHRIALFSIALLIVASVVDVITFALLALAR